MTTRRVLPWVVGALAVLAIALGGVFANLAVLQSGEADAAIGSLSAKGIAGGETWTIPATPIPVPHVDAQPDDSSSARPAPPTTTSTPTSPHHDGAGHHDGDDD